MSEPQAPDQLTTGPIKVSRRFFLASAFSLVLAACGVAPNKSVPITPDPAKRTMTPTPFATPDMTVLHEPKTRPNGTEVTGTIDEPENYSHFIVDNNLRPTVYGEVATKREMVDAAVNYLRRLREAMKNSGDQGPKFRDFGINSQDNIPINIDNDYSVFTHIDNLLNEIEQGKIELQDGKQTDAVLSTITNIGWDDSQKQWVRNNSVIYYNDYLDYDKKFYRQGTNSTYYQGRSDLDIAIALVHEYAHIKQRESQLNILNSDPQLKLNPDKDQWYHNYIPNQIADVAKKVIARHIPNGLDETHRQQVISLVNKVNFNEVQADTVAFVIFDYINKLNNYLNNGHIPGARVRDPAGYSYNMTDLGERYPGQKIVNKYEAFIRDVRDTDTHDSLNARWAIEWSWLGWVNS